MLLRDLPEKKLFAGCGPRDQKKSPDWHEPNPFALLAIVSDDRTGLIARDAIGTRLILKNNCVAGIIDPVRPIFTIGVIFEIANRKVVTVAIFDTIERPHTNVGFTLRFDAGIGGFTVFGNGSALTRDGE